MSHPFRHHPDTPSEGMILDSIAFSYGRNQILHGVYMSIPPAEITGLAGRNGSGKSTLMKIAAGELNPSGGITILDDERFTRSDRQERYRHIAYLPQESMIPSSFTLRQLLEIMTGQEEIASDDLADLHRDPLASNRFDHPFGTLSTGERRYLTCRFLLLFRRSYLLLDEPFTGLSPVMIEQLSQLLRRRADEGQGILLSDHYVDYVLPLVDRLWLLKDGYCSEVARTGDYFGELNRMGYLGMPRHRR